MGENIGDLSGLAQAYRAYKISLGGKEAPVRETACIGRRQIA